MPKNEGYGPTFLRICPRHARVFAILQEALRTGELAMFFAEADQLTELFLVRRLSLEFVYKNFSRDIFSRVLGDLFNGDGRLRAEKQIRRGLRDYCKVHCWKGRY